MFERSWLLAALALINVTAQACDGPPCTNIRMDAAEPKVLAVDSTSPIVAFRSSDAAIHVLSCADALCNSGTTTMIWKDPAGLYADGIDLIAGDEGLPLLAFRESLQRIRTVACGNPGCTAGNVHSTHSNGLDIEAPISLSRPAASGSRPLLAYIVGGFVGLKRCSDTKCTAATAANVYHVNSTGVPLFASRVAIAHRFDALPYLAYLPKGEKGLAVGLCGTPDCGNGVNAHGIATQSEIVEVALSVNQYYRAVLAFQRKDGSIASVACGASCSDPGPIADIAQPALGSGEVDFARGASEIPMLVWAGDGLGAMRCSDPFCAKPNLASVVLDPGEILSSRPSLTIPDDGLPLLVVQRNGIGKPSIAIHKCASPSCL